MDYKEFMFRMYVKEIEANIIKPESFNYQIGNTVTCKCGGNSHAPRFRNQLRPAGRLALAEILVLLQDFLLLYHILSPLIFTAAAFACSDMPNSPSAPAPPLPPPARMCRTFSPRPCRRCLKPSHTTDGQVVEAIQHFAQHVSRRVPEHLALAGPRVDGSRTGDGFRSAAHSCRRRQRRRRRGEMQRRYR